MLALLPWPLLGAQAQTLVLPLFSRMTSKKSLTCSSWGSYTKLRTLQ